MSASESLYHDQINEMEEDPAYNQWADKMYEQDREHQIEEEKDEH